MYRFRSQATADVLMLDPHGDALLRALGREPAGRGIIEVESMPAALQALQAAIQADDECGAASPARADLDDEPAPPEAEAVSLRRRWWPMVEMLRRCHAAREPVVWGV